MNFYNQKSNGLINWLDLRTSKYRVIYWSMFAFLMLMCVICIIPVLWVFLSGFKTVDEMYAVPPSLFPKEIDIRKAIVAWNTVNMFSGLKNTFYITIGCVVVDIGVNGLAGFVLSKVRPTGSALLDTIYFWSMLLPGMSMVPLYMTFIDFTPLHINLSGTFFPMWMMAGASAFHIFLFRNAFNAIPTTYFEAAKLDGCSNFGSFIRIIIPLAKPTVVVVAVFQIIGQWGTYMWPYLLFSQSDSNTIGLILFKISQGNFALASNEVLLVLMMSIIPPLIIYAIFSKQVMGGVDMSGIKE